MVRRFHGGVHPGENKLTADSPIQDFGIPKQVIIPLQQHIGAPTRPVVKVGDEVKKGSLLGESGGFVSAPVHASIGGKVKAIAPFATALGMSALSVTIEGSGDETWADGCNIERDITKFKPDEIRTLIHNGGLVGMGGATFPTHVKLSPPENKPIDTFIVNGVECEPYLTADDRVMVETPEKVLDGAEILRRALGCSKCIIGIEDNKPHAIRVMTEAAKKRKDITVLALHVRYPQGAEKQLIYAALGREVPSGGLPMDVGVVVQNVGTCSAADDAVRFARPLIERVVTVTGPCAKAPGNYRMRVGTLLSDVLARLGAADDMNEIILGGPMMGLAQPSREIPITKGASGILLTRRTQDAPTLACIRCGRCVDACPVMLTPSRLSTLLEMDMVQQAEEWNIADCIECGCCTFVCPSKRPIVHQVKYGKAELRRLKAKK